MSCNAPSLGEDRDVPSVSASSLCEHFARRVWSMTSLHTILLKTLAETPTLDNALDVGKIRVTVHRFQHVVGRL